MVSLDQGDEHEVGMRQAFRGKHHELGDRARTWASAGQLRRVIPAPPGCPFRHDAQRTCLAPDAQPPPEFRAISTSEVPFLGQPIEVGVEGARPWPEHLAAITAGDGADTFARPTGAAHDLLNRYPGRHHVLDDGIRRRPQPPALVLIALDSRHHVGVNTTRTHYFLDVPH